MTVQKMSEMWDCEGALGMLEVSCLVGLVNICEQWYATRIPHGIHAGMAPKISPRFHQVLKYALKSATGCKTLETQVNLMSVNLGWLSISPQIRSGR